MRSTKFNILQYSCLAGAFLSLNSKVSAEIIYTDISPDFILLQDDDPFYLDINIDGVSDFKFINNYFTHGGYYTSGGYYSLFEVCQKIFAFPMAGASFAGNKYLTYSSSDFRYCPFALEENFSISASLQFQNDWLQYLVYKCALGGWSGPASIEGHWYPEVSDHYLGVRFNDLATSVHYGWIRCDVIDEGRILIIKDFAYETNEDTRIFAGDTIGDTSIVAINEFTELNANIYCFDKTINVTINETLKNVEINIYTIAGQKIHSDKITNQSTQIELNDPSGAFIVELISPEGKFSKKILIK